MKAHISNVVGIIIIAIAVIALLLLNLAPDNAIQLAVVSTVFAAVSSIATLMQARETQKQREDAERPEVAVYLQPASNRLLYCVIQNFGVLPARNVRIQFKPSPVRYDGKLLEEISLFQKPIPYLPPNEKYWRHLGPGPTVLEKNQEPFEISVQYESTSGKSFKDTIVIDLSVFAQANDPAPSIGDQLAIVSQQLGKLVSVLEKPNEHLHP